MSTRTNSGTGVAAANSAFTIPFTFVTGRSGIVALNHETALNGITVLTDNAAGGSNNWVQDYGDTAPGGEGRRVFRCQAIGNVPTTLTCTSTTAGTIHYVVVEATGLNASPFEAVTPVNESANTTTHSLAFTSLNANALAVALILSNTDPGTITPTTGFTEIPDTRNARAAFYKDDLGAAGSQTLGYTSSSTNTAKALIALYKSAAVDPTVVSVTGVAATEGSAIRYTVVLSGATYRDTNFAASFTGGTATSADYDTNLSHTGGHATYSNGVTFSGGNMVCPTGQSGWTFDVNTIQDALDEVSPDTVIVTVGGVASTAGAITDDDPLPNATLGDATESFGVVTMPITLDAPSGRDLTFYVDTVNGTKTAGVDFTGITHQLVTITAGNTTASVPVTVL